MSLSCISLYLFHLCPEIQVIRLQAQLSNTKSPLKSRHFLPISNNKFRVKVSVILRSGEMQQFIATRGVAFGGHFVTFGEKSKRTLRDAY